MSRRKYFKQLCDIKYRDYVIHETSNELWKRTHRSQTLISQLRHWQSPLLITQYMIIQYDTPSVKFTHIFCFQRRFLLEKQLQEAILIYGFTLKHIYAKLVSCLHASKGVSSNQTSQSIAESLAMIIRKSQVSRFCPSNTWQQQHHSC